MHLNLKIIMEGYLNTSGFTIRELSYAMEAAERAVELFLMELLLVFLCKLFQFLLIKTWEVIAVSSVNVCSSHNQSATSVEAGLKSKELCKANPGITMPWVMSVSYQWQNQIVSVQKVSKIEKRSQIFSTLSWHSWPFIWNISRNMINLLCEYSVKKRSMHLVFSLFPIMRVVILSQKVTVSALQHHL